METPVIPGLELTLIIDWMTQFFFLSLRIGAFLLAGPGFGGRYVPLPIRIVATMVLTLPLMGRVDVPPAEQIAHLAAFHLILNELIIGLSGGLTLTILLAAAAIAGDRIANTAGLGFAAQMDPSAGAQVPVIAQIFGMFLLMIFVSTDSHLVAFRIVLDSYLYLPPGDIPNPAALIAGGLTAGMQMFTLGMKIMLPVVATLLLLNMMVGVFTRSAPQLNVFSFGFPITISATLVLLFLTVPGTADAFDRLLQDGLNMLVDIYTEAANG